MVPIWERGPAGSGASVGLMLTVVLLDPASAQILNLPGPNLPNPDMRSPIPAPLPPPPRPPIINGPTLQVPPPRVYTSPRINSFGDQLSICSHEGAAQGLHGRKLKRYAQECADR